MKKSTAVHALDEHAFDTTPKPEPLSHHRQPFRKTEPALYTLEKDAAEPEEIHLPSRTSLAGLSICLLGIAALLVGLAFFTYASFFFIADLLPAPLAVCLSGVSLLCLLGVVARVARLIV